MHIIIVEVHPAMRLLNLLILILFSIELSFADNHMPETEEWLQRLDSVILQRPVYNAMKKQRLSDMQKNQSKQRTPHEIITFNSMLYDECYVFDSDLAMNCVQQNLSIARQLGDKALEVEWTIKESFILAATGLLKEALDVMEPLNISNQPNSIKIAYYSQMTYLYSHFGQYTGSGALQDQYTGLEHLYNDSIHQFITREDPEFLWHDVWYRINTGDLESTREQLRIKVDLSSMNTREDAMGAYALANIYRNAGDEDMFIRYLAMSGVADLRASNKDIASIQELAEILLERGDISRAYTYMNVCLQTSQEYHNRVRSVSIARVHDNILQEFLKRDETQRGVLKRANYLLIVLIVLLIIAIAWIVTNMVRLNHSRKKLHEMNKQLMRGRSELSLANQHLKEANESLQKVNEKMQQTNDQLKESNLVKEEYVGYVFSICSNYISKLEEYRKDINRKAKAKMLPEILAMTEKQTVVQDELKEFYQNFDAIFLHIYPNFINEFNSLLAPEERIEPRKGELLNTDLRIYALVRLGITDSVKISEFLHCSPQTVYNNRLKVRNKAIVPKENFTEAVRNLGSATD